MNRHFDPNDSGSVHYGEFVWAFFNRRGFVRQWRRNTRGLTEAQIVSKFQAADTSGNGQLNPKEFRKLLKGFGIELPAHEQEILTAKFDLDGDGDLDMLEFHSFIESEKQHLEGEEERGGVALLSSSYNNTPQYRASSVSPPVPPPNQERARAQGQGAGRPSIHPSSRSSRSRSQSSSRSRSPSSSSKGSSPPGSRPQSAASFSSSAASGRSRASRPSSAPAIRRGEKTHPPPAYTDAVRGAHKGGENTYPPPAYKESKSDSQRSFSSRGRADEDFGEEHGRREEKDSARSDPLWMVQSLHAQSQVESKLGGRYYN